MEISIPFLATFAEVCETLRQRFQRIVHFRYINDKNVWLEVRSEQALAAFRFQVGEEGLEKDTSIVVAQVQLLPFGSGAGAVSELLRDGLILSSLSHFQPIEERAKLMACVSESQSDEPGAADRARAIMQSAEGGKMLLEEADHLGRTALHLAAAEGRRLLVQALLSGPKDTRKAGACARDLKGRTALHYAWGEHVAVSLLQACADPQATDAQGATPLHTIRDPGVADRLIKGKAHGAPHDACLQALDKVPLHHLTARPLTTPPPHHAPSLISASPPPLSLLPISLLGIPVSTLASLTYSTGGSNRVRQPAPPPSCGCKLG